MNESKRYGTTLYRIIAALSHRLTPADVADGVAREAAKVFDASAAMVALFDDAADRVRIVASVGYPASLSERWTGRPMSELDLVTTVRRGQALFARSRACDARFDAALTQIFGDGAGFLAPLAVGDHVIGGLGMSFDHVREFDEEERAFISSLAAHCAQSLERARLFEAARNATAAAESARCELDAVLDQLPIGVVVTRTDGRIVINDEARRIFGTDRRTSSVERRDRLYPPSILKHPDGRDYTAEEVPVTRALAGETIRGEELFMTCSDGTQCLVRVTAVPVRNEAAEIEAAVATFSDITEERSIAEQLRKTERRHDAVLRATNDVIWEVDPNTRHVEWNDAFQQQLGHDPDEVNRHPDGGLGWWIESIHPDDRDRVVRSYEAARDGGDETWTSEYRMRRADDTYVATFERSVFERDRNGEVLRIIGSMSDVSEHRRLLDELREAVLVRDDFLSIAGHELRTPIAALSAQLVGLRQLPLDEAARLKKLAAAARQVRRLTALADELLDVSRIVHGKLQLQRDETDLAVVVTEAAERLEEEFQRGNTPLRVAAGERVSGDWDRLRLDLVITNLLTNALRYGDKQPVDVRVEADGERARVTVADRGIGIRPEDQARIFERFVRAAPARQFGGLGVGLWLARQIAEAHGGTLRVVSAPDAGSTFTLELPRTR